MRRRVRSRRAEMFLGAEGAFLTYELDVFFIVERRGFLGEVEARRRFLSWWCVS